MAKKDKQDRQDKQAEEVKAGAEGDRPEFIIQRLYVKDISYEAPKTPAIFKDEWKPEVSLDLQTNSSVVESNVHEVVLHLTVTVKMADQTAFLVEVKQAGIFTIKGIEGDQLKHTLGSYCPGVIFPYARETVSDVVIRGGFPQLNLAPINFDALYNQYMQQQAEQEAKKGGDQEEVRH